MTLTNDDLQSIRKVVHEEVRNEVKTQLQSELKPLESRLTKQMKQETKTIVEFFDNEYLGHDKRIKRIETHLGLSSINS